MLYIYIYTGTCTYIYIFIYIYTTCAKPFASLKWTKRYEHVQ